MNDYQKMSSAKLYIGRIDPKIMELKKKREEFLDAFNATKFGEEEKRTELCRKYFKHVGSNCIIQKPFLCDYACNISIGDNFYANFDCVMLDVNSIEIGNNVFIAPRVCLFTAGHPIDKDVRNKHLEYGYPIKIGNDVWIGGNSVINPGVTIGNNVVIGSNSVVTHDIPDNVIAAGNPCKVIRQISESDRKYWQEKEKEYFEN